MWKKSLPKNYFLSMTLSVLHDSFALTLSCIFLNHLRSGDLIHLNVYPFCLWIIRTTRGTLEARSGRLVAYVNRLWWRASTFPKPSVPTLPWDRSENESLKLLAREQFRKDFPSISTSREMSTDERVRAHTRQISLNEISWGGLKASSMPNVAHGLRVYI